MPMANSFLVSRSAAGAPREDRRADARPRLGRARSRGSRCSPATSAFADALCGSGRERIGSREATTAQRRLRTISSRPRCTSDAGISTSLRNLGEQQDVAVHGLDEGEVAGVPTPSRFHVPMRTDAVRRLAARSPAEFGPFQANENGPRSRVPAVQRPFPGYDEDQMS